MCPGTQAFPKVPWSRGEGGAPHSQGRELGARRVLGGEQILGVPIPYLHRGERGTLMREKHQRRGQEVGANRQAMGTIGEVSKCSVSAVDQKFLG